MSKLCDSNSISFMYLEILSNTLLDDSANLENEFKTKFEFILEQEKQILDNEQNLKVVGEYLAKVQSRTDKIEKDIQENEINIIELEKSLKIMENSQSIISSKRCVQIGKSDYEELLQLTIAVNLEIAQINQSKLEIKDFSAGAYMSPFKLISSILDYHIKTLETTEQRLNIIEAKSDEIATIYNKICCDMDISTISTTPRFNGTDDI